MRNHCADVKTATIINDFIKNTNFFTRLGMIFLGSLKGFDGVAAVVGIRSTWLVDKGR